MGREIYKTIINVQERHKDSDNIHKPIFLIPGIPPAHLEDARASMVLTTVLGYFCVILSHDHVFVQTMANNFEVQTAA
jgi:hypothetical protein